MPQLKKPMSIAAQLSKPGDRLLGIIEQDYGLASGEFAIAEEFVFLDGRAIVRRQIDSVQLITALLNLSDSCNITLVLAPMAVNDEGAYTRQVVDAGGSVAFQAEHETFSQVVERNREICLTQPSDKASLRLPVAQNEEFKASLSPYYWPSADLAALREAYLLNFESKAILS